MEAEFGTVGEGRGEERVGVLKGRGSSRLLVIWIEAMLLLLLCFDPDILHSSLCLTFFKE